MRRKAKQRIADLGEFGLIDLIKGPFKAHASVIKGIGDDTAVVALTSGKYLLLTTDMLVEGVHFNKDTPPRMIGRKALGCSLSDIAAMGGVPKYALISIGIPKMENLKKIKQIYAGIKMLARKYKVDVIGGDTVKSSRLVINVSLLGEVKRKDLVCRDGASPGDQIFVTGQLGRSLKNEHHYRFDPRIKEAQDIVKQFRPSAMIDISDGLAADLGHILRESKVGAVLSKETIPRRAKATLQQALSDGEDFELLFTLPPKEARKMNKRKQKFVTNEMNRGRPQTFEL